MLLIDVSFFSSLDDSLTVTFCSWNLHRSSRLQILFCQIQGGLFSSGVTNLAQFLEPLVFGIARVRVFSDTYTEMLLSSFKNCNFTSSFLFARFFVYIFIPIQFFFKSLRYGQKQMYFKISRCGDNRFDSQIAGQPLILTFSDCIQKFHKSFSYLSNGIIHLPQHNHIPL